MSEVLDDGVLDSDAEVLQLAGPFPDSTREDWRAQVERVLDRKGQLSDDELAARYERELVTELLDGFTVGPVHAREDLPAAAANVGVPGASPFVRGATADGAVVNGWDVRQAVVLDPDDPAGTATAALDELEHGATSLLLRAPVDDVGVDAATLDACLDGVLEDLVALDAEDPALAPALLGLWDRRDTGEAATGTLGLDPVGTRLVDADADVEDAFDAALDHVRTAIDRHPQVRPLAIDGRHVHEAGGSDAQELGTAIAAGVTTLRLLDDAGIGPDAALPLLAFRFAATADQFSNIAKLRAGRRLWARVAEELGVEGAAGAMHQHAVASRAMLTRYDPWVNLLRGTVAVMAAGVGGAAAVTAEAHDVLHQAGRGSGLGRRMARNTQSILQLESHLGAALDPAGGSYYVEWLTDRLARAAWDWFREVEAAGGLVRATSDGLVAERVDATWQQRAERIAHRRQPVTGVSEYPATDEDVPPPPADDPTARDDDDTGDGTTLPRRRYAQGYERLRDRAAAHEQATGAPPKVLLAELGTVAQSTGRSTFAANLFGAGGLDSVTWRAQDGTDALADLVAEHDVAVACLCSTDEVYAEEGADAVSALRDAGVSLVHLAGRPVDDVEVDAHVFLGCDALAVLRTALDEAGVA